MTWALLLEQDNRLVAEGKLLKTKLLNWLVEATSTLALPNLDSTCDENHVVNTLPLAASTAADVGFIGLDVLPRLATDSVLIRSNHTRTKLVKYPVSGRRSRSEAVRVAAEMIVRRMPHDRFRRKRKMKELTRPRVCLTMVLSEN